MIKKGNQVEVIYGKDKGKKGEIIEILRLKNTSRIKIKGINMIKKHEKTTKEKKGGIITKESFLDISNVKNIDLKKKETKGKKWYQDYKNSITKWLFRTYRKSFH